MIRDLPLLGARHRGFTLVELVVVIVVLGILGAVVVSLYGTAPNESRLAKGRAVLGAIQTAAVIAHSAARVKALETAASGSSLTMEGSEVTLVYGYPDGSETGIERAANLSAVPGIAVAHNGSGTTTVTLMGVSNPADCRITYVVPSLAGEVPTITFTGSASGCS